MSNTDEEIAQAQRDEAKARAEKAQHEADKAREEVKHEQAKTDKTKADAEKTRSIDWSDIGKTVAAVGALGLSIATFIVEATKDKK